MQILLPLLAGGAVLPGMLPQDWRSHQHARSRTRHLVQSRRVIFQYPQPGATQAAVTWCRRTLPHLPARQMPSPSVLHLLCVVPGIVLQLRVSIRLLCSYSQAFPACCLLACTFAALALGSLLCSSLPSASFFLPHLALHR